MVVQPGPPAIYRSMSRPDLFQNMLINKFRKYIAQSKQVGLLMLVVFVVIPFRQFEFWLNGLPFDTIEKSILLIIVFPLLYIFNANFLRSKRIKWLLLIGILTKLFGNMLFPSQGIEAKVYSLTPEGLKCQKTYEGIWLKQAEFIISKPLSSKEHFPAEWINCRKDNSRDTISLGLEIQTHLEVEQNIKLDFSKILGLKNGSYLTINEKHIIPKNDSLCKSIPRISEVTLGPGIYVLNGLLLFNGKDWCFDILSDCNGVKRTILGQGNVHTLIPEKFVIQHHTHLIYLICVLLNLLTLIIVGFWIVETLKFLKVDFVSYSFYTLCISLLAFVKHYVGIRLDDLANFVLLYAFVSLFISWARKKSNFKADFFFGFSIVLIHFFSYFKSQLQLFKWYSIGDDWLTYQRFARNIVLDGDWINWGEASMVYQPLYRFFVGVFHVFFGQSSFSQNMFDVWCIMGISYLLYLILNLLKCRNYISFSIALLFLFTILKPGLNRFIGSGLQEIVAAFFMILSLYLVIKQLFSDSKKYLHLAGLIASIAIWLRTEHIIVITSFGLFLLPEKIKYFNVFNYSDFRKYILYIVASIVLLLLKICLQNLSFFDHHDISFTHAILTFSKAFVLCLPRGESFLWFKFIFLFGILASILLLFQILRNHNRKYISIILCLYASFLPYLIFEVQGYFHRFCIHVIPVSLITIALYLNHVLLALREKRSRFYSNLRQSAD